MIEFMGDGNIRIIPEIPALNLQVEPTREQYKKIKTYIESVGNRDNYFLIEFDNKNGDTVADREYENDIDSEKIIEDIEFYFKNGELPYKSELQQFREEIDENNIAKRLNSYIQDDNLIEEIQNKIIAYHGSQEDNLQLENRPLYLTNEKELAEMFAQGSNFGYKLLNNELPTVYTIEIENGNYKKITTEEEYDEIMDIVNIEDTRKKYADYDGIIYKDENGLIYYLIFDPANKCRIIKKERVEE